MSKGNRIVPVRIPELLYREMVEDCELRNLTCVDQEWSISDYIRAGIRELLRKRRAGRRPGRKRK